MKRRRAFLREILPTQLSRARQQADTPSCKDRAVFDWIDRESAC